MNGNDEYFGKIRRMIQNRNRGIPGRTKRVTPACVHVSVGNKQPDRYLVVDSEGHVWQFDEVYQKTGERLTTCLHLPLVLHFDGDGEVAYAVHQESEAVHAHQ